MWIFSSFIYFAICAFMLPSGFPSFPLFSFYFLLVLIPFPGFLFPPHGYPFRLIPLTGTELLPLCLLFFPLFFIYSKWLHPHCYPIFRFLISRKLYERCGVKRVPRREAAAQPIPVLTPKLLPTRGIAANAQWPSKIVALGVGGSFDTKC